MVPARAGALLALFGLLLSTAVGRGQEREQAAAAAESAGRTREAFDLYVAAYQALPDPPPSDTDLRLRGHLVRLAAKLPAPPQAPEEADRSMARARAALSEAKDDAGYEAAEAELRKALYLAPWSAPAAYNLGLVLERLEDYQRAMGNLKLYLLGNVPDAADVKAKLYELEYKWEQIYKEGKDDIDITYGQRMNTGFFNEQRLSIARDKVRAQYDNWNGDVHIVEESGAMTKISDAAKTIWRWSNWREHAEYCAETSEKETSTTRDRNMRRRYERSWNHFFDIRDAKRTAVPLNTKRTIAGQTCEDWRFTVGTFGSIQTCLMPAPNLPPVYTVNFSLVSMPMCDMISPGALYLTQAAWQELALRDAAQRGGMFVRYVPLAWRFEPSPRYEFRDDIGHVDIEATQVKIGPIPPRVFKIPAGYAVR